MVHLYAFDIRALPDPKVFPDILELLHGERKLKTMKYLRTDDRKRCLGAGILLEKVLPLYGASANKITYGTNGKPETEGIYFNISHADEFVICAVSKTAVGCDIEKIGDEAAGIAKRFFHKNETEYLNTFKDKKRNETFFRLWTLKESYIKMTGEGLSIPLNCFEILFEAENIRIKREGKILPCHIMEYGLPDYKISVCAGEGQFEKNIHYMNI